MPIIPIIRQTGPIANAPAPVLDRERRPTVDAGREIAAVGRLGQAAQMPLDRNDYTGPLRALGAVGEAVMRTGNVMSAMAEKRQEATDRRLINQAQMAMDQAAQEFSAWQAANPNAPEAWEAEARARSEKLVSPFLEMKELSQAAKSDLQLMGQSWAQRFVGGVQVESTKAIFGLAKGSYVDRARRAFETDDFDGGRMALDEAVKGGYLHETDREALLFEGEQKMKARLEEQLGSRYEVAVLTGDEKALQATIDEGKAKLGWDKDYAEARRLKGMEGIERTKQVMAAQEESAFLGEVMMKKAQGEVFVPQQVDAWVKEGKLDKQTGARLRVALQSEAGAMTGEFMDFLNKEVDAYDPESDPDGLKVYELRKKADLLGLNQRQRELYEMRFEKALKVNADPKAKPLEAVRRAAKSQIGEMFKDVGKTRVWDDDLEGALRDPAKLEAWGVPKEQAGKIKLLVEGGKVDGKDVLPDKPAALKLFREQSLSRKERGESGLTEWEYNLFSKAADASGDLVADPEKQFGAEFNRAIVEEAFDNWYDSETAKRGAPPSDNEARQWVGDKTRAVIQGAGAVNFFKETTPPPAAGAAAPATPGAIDEGTVSMIKEFESFIPEAYGDYKQTSVGYGTRARFDGEVLTEPEADARLREELAGHVARVDKLAAQKGVTLTAAQRSALISFDFNTGAVHRVFERGGSDKSRYAAIMKEWKNAGGKVLQGLVNRRAKEAAAFE